MNSIKYFTSIGLILDILGATVLILGIFREDIRSLVDSGDYKTKCRSISEFGYLDIAKKVKYRCREHLYTWMGISSLVFGFFLQLISQLITPKIVNNQCLMFYSLLIAAVMLFVSVLLVYKYTHLKHSAVIELFYRITPQNFRCGNNSPNCPANVPYKECNDAAKVFLRYNMPFLRFGKKDEEAINRVFNESEKRNKKT